MNAPANIEQLKIVARGLGTLKEEMVFVGGAIVELYATDPAAPSPRPTLDVDCFIEVSSRSEYADVEQRLESRGFKPDLSKGAPICRWIYEGITVDVMPTDERILGFSNRWYSRDLGRTTQRQLAPDMTITILAAPAFIAAKLEALRNRGERDLRVDPDFEDVIFVMDNRENIVQEIAKAETMVQEFVREQLQSYFESPRIDEYLAAVLPYGSGDAYIQRLKERIERVITEVN